jgi:hypothetical protein
MSNCCSHGTLHREEPGPSTSIRVGPGCRLGCSSTVGFREGPILVFVPELAASQRWGNLEERLRSWRAGAGSIPWGRSRPRCTCAGKSAESNLIAVCWLHLRGPIFTGWGGSHQLQPVGAPPELEGIHVTRVESEASCGPVATGRGQKPAHG